MACAKQKTQKDWKASALRFESANPFQFSFIAKAQCCAYIYYTEREMYNANNN